MAYTSFAGVGTHPQAMKIYPLLHWIKSLSQKGAEKGKTKVNMKSKGKRENIEISKEIYSEWKKKKGKCINVVKEKKKL